MRTETIDFYEFVNGDYKKRGKPPTFSLLPLAAAPFIPIKVFAEEISVKEKMMNAFTPIIDLIQGMAYPVAMVVVLGGAIMVMIGNSEKGFTMMQRAGMGYLLVMIAPMILDVLVDAMEGVV